MTEETVYALVAFGGDFDDAWTKNIRVYAKQDYAEAEAAILNDSQVVLDRALATRSRLVGVWVSNNKLDDESDAAAEVWLKGLEETEASIDAALGLDIGALKWCEGTRFRVEPLTLVN